VRENNTPNHKKKPEKTVWPKVRKTCITHKIPQTEPKPAPSRP